jgi:GntR family transcriptional regulator
MGKLRGFRPRTGELTSVLRAAQIEARRLGVSYVATEHVLKGIAQQSHTRGAKMISRFGVNLADIIREVDQMSTGGESALSAAASKPVPTEGTRDAFEAASREAERAERGEVGSDFMILGLLIEARGEAAKILGRLGVTLERVRQHLDSERVVNTEAGSAPLSRERRPRGFGRSAPNSVRETEELRSVFTLVKDEARRLRSPAIDTEHLLLAIAHTPESDATRLLGRLGVDLAALTVELEREAADAAARPSDAKAGYSIAMLRAVQAARSEWLVSRRETISSAQMLLGVLIEGTGIAAKTLARFGITIERVREAMAADSNQGRDAFHMEIDESSDVSIYEQIIARVREAVATGVLKPGDRLPPVRQLADRLDIAPGTVARAYTDLESRGVVITEGARGTRIARQDRSSVSGDSRRAALVELLRPVAVAAFHLGASTTDLHTALDAATQDIFRGERGAA